MSEFLEDMAVFSGKKPAGYGVVWRVIRAYDARLAIPAEDLATLIDALRAFTLNGTTDKELQEFGRRAKLRGKQGRHEPTAAEAQQRISMVAEVLLQERDLVKNGISSRKARAQATKEASVTHHRSLRKVQQAIVEFGEYALSEIDAIDRLGEQMEQINGPARVAEKWLDDQKMLLDQFHVSFGGIDRANKS